VKEKGISIHKETASKRLEGLVIGVQKMEHLIIVLLKLLILILILLIYRQLKANFLATITLIPFKREIKIK
jgi:hypothetical protein